MPYPELIRLYFDRSNALQNYWTLYVVVIGGLLAFSTLRRRPDVVKSVLVCLLYVGFAYKNLSALCDVTAERLAILHAIDAATVPADAVPLHRELRPALNPTPYAGVRNFHLACDVMTLSAVLAMEWRRRTPQSVVAPAE